MQAEEMGVRERLLASAKEEFLAHGFRNASLRRICAKAGVTTGALYFFFRNKEQLFGCIVEKPLAAYEKMIQCVVESDWENSAIVLQNEETIIRFLMKYKEECQLILEKSQGTEYEGFYERYKAWIEEICTSFFEKNTPGNVNRNLIKLLVNMRLQGYLEVVKGNFTFEEAIELIRYMAYYADAGLTKLVSVLNKENN